MTAALGDVSDDQVWRILRKYGICLQRRRSWCIRTDPEFGPKAADIVGLYLEPPVNALVLCVDEKPSIQALERAQGQGEEGEWSFPLPEQETFDSKLNPSKPQRVGYDRH